MSEWHETVLGEVVELKRGYDLPAKNREPGSAPIVSSSGVTGYHREAKVRGPGVVTGRYGTIGEVFYVPNDFWPLNTTLYVRNFKGNDPRFISYFLRGLDFNAYSDKAAVPGINRNHLHQAAVRYPVDVCEQRSIVNLLGALDDKIDVNRRMNETLEEMAHALFKDWFVDFGPTKAKMEGRTPYLEADLWALFPERLDEEGKPEGWTHRLLGDLFDISIGRTPPRKEKQHFVPGGQGRTWLSIKTMGGLQVFAFDSEEDLTADAVSRFRVPLIPAGTVIVSFKLTVGRVAIAANDMHSNEAIAHLVPHRGTPVSTESTYLFMRSFDYSTLGSTSSIATAVNSQSIKAIKMLVAEPGVQHAFTRLVAPLLGRIKANGLESRTLIQTRNLLLPKLMSGEICVKEAKASVYEVV